MQCNLLPIHQQPPVPPKQYLSVGFKLHILEHLLQSIVKRPKRASYEVIRDHGRGYRSHHYDQNRVTVHGRLRTQMDTDVSTLSIDVSKLTEQYESPYRTKEKSYKTQYFRPTSPTFQGPAPDLMNITSQEYFRYHEMVNISPYQKKHTVAFLEHNEKIEEFGQRSRSALRLEEKGKRFGAIIAGMAIRYQICKREMIFFQKLQGSDKKLKEMGEQLAREKQKIEIMSKKEQQQILREKLSVFSNLNAVYKYLLKKTFQSLKEFQPENESQGEQYTIVYVKDQENQKPSNPTTSSSMKINLTAHGLPTKTSMYSHRSDKTNLTKSKD